MTLPANEFLRRFLLYVLPRGFVRIRNFGFLANRRGATLLPICFELLRRSTEQTPSVEAAAVSPQCSDWRCPVCGGTMRIVERISAAQLLLTFSATGSHVRCMNSYSPSRSLRVYRNAKENPVSFGLLTRSASVLAVHPPRKLLLLGTLGAQCHKEGNKIGADASTADSIGSFKLHNRPPTQGFLQVAVSEAPTEYPHKRIAVPRGRSRYGPNTFEY